jgi:hypothetical protein
MSHRFTILLVIPLTILCACAQEATAPQGAAAVSQVVPVVAPDVWCSAIAADHADTVATQRRCRTTVNAPPPRPGAGDSTWHTMSGTLRYPRDSVAAPRDTTAR